MRSSRAVLLKGFDHSHEVLWRNSGLNVVYRVLASGRVFEKAGFTKEGVRKEQVFKDGRYIDVLYWGLVNPEDRKHSIPLACRGFRNESCIYQTDDAVAERKNRKIAQNRQG